MYEQPESIGMQSARPFIAALACLAGMMFYMAYLTRPPEKLTLRLIAPSPPPILCTDIQISVGDTVRTSDGISSGHYYIVKDLKVPACASTSDHHHTITDTAATCGWWLGTVSGATSQTPIRSGVPTIIPGESALYNCVSGGAVSTTEWGKEVSK